MAQSYISYLGDGSTTVFSLTFPYLAKSHVKVYVGGVEDTTFTWLTSSSISLSTAPASNALILVKRETPTIPIVDFVDGSVITETLLDTASIQSLYVAEETKDKAATAITLNQFTDKWEGGGKVLSSLADPLVAQDAATKVYVDGFMNTSVANAAASAAAALVSENASKASENASKASENASKASELASKASELAAANSASYAYEQATDPNLVLVALDLAQGGVDNISDLGSIDDPATSSGIGTSYIKVVRDNISSIQNAASNAATATTQAGIATTKANSASQSETNAATSATNAANSASASANSAATSSTQANNSAFSASSASTSASTATTKASEASASATASANSATASASSATTAEAHKVAAQAALAAAEAARDQTLTAYDQFDDRYLGNKASDPALDNDGNALLGGALYFNSVSGSMKLYTGTQWVNAYVSGGGFATTAITVSAGSGLTGGGDLSANRTIGIATGGVTASMLASTLDLGTI